ncbi:enoyl-CoA hydratase-related protein, partial [Nonomuraea sp. NPDC049784]|uniref:enoyl-CoA hydratase-related protein n=1 Tax=Nonomuraea sp. NPDC049784 TaxID=3154361 RepID=UPI0033F764AB
MGITLRSGPLAEVVVDVPPVNALTVRGWQELAESVRRAGDEPETRVVVLRAEGRGFNAGVDIKELRDAEGHEALVRTQRTPMAADRASPERYVSPGQRGPSRR